MKSDPESPFGHTERGDVTAKVADCSKEDKRMQSWGPLEHPEEPPKRLQIVCLVIWALKAALK